MKRLARYGTDLRGSAAQNPQLPGYLTVEERENKWLR
jgi:hypothetical protein